MYKHILLPLDGSKLAEAAIPVALEFCRKLKSEIVLLHVIEKDAPDKIHGQKHLTSESEAEAYLSKIAKRNFSDCPVIKTHVHTEEVSQLAAGIVLHTSEFSPDLIILCAHGEGGLRDFVVGSIAQQVIASGKVPVLLLQPGKRVYKKIRSFHKILVPLDGDPEHEQSLNSAAELVGLLSAAVHLVRVVPTLFTLSGPYAATGILLPSTTEAYLEIAEEEACDYLQLHFDDLKKSKINVSAEVRRGDPAAEVVKSAEEQNSDLIVLGTHGKSGMGAFWSASTAPKIVSRTRLPILLLPVRRN